MEGTRFVRTKLPSFVAKPDPSAYNSNNFVVLDFETTAHNNGLAIYPENRIVLAVWYNGVDHPRPGWHSKRAGEFELTELVDDINAADFLVAHNTKFELMWLDRCGLDLGSVLCWDTMLAEYVIGGNRWLFQKLSLGACARRRGLRSKDDLVSKMIKGGIDPEEIPSRWLHEYCVIDVMLCLEIFTKQRESIPEKMKAIVYTRCLLTPVLCDLEKTGLVLDGETVRTRLEDTEREYGELSRKLEEVSGGINFNSGPQLRQLLFEDLGFSVPNDHRGRPILTPSGVPKTDTEAISRLKPRTKRQKEFLALYVQAREKGQELTKYLRKFDHCVRDDDGLMYAQFNQTNTQTHRLSSSGLDYSTQFQNLPRAYKPMFRARREGWRVGEADGAQLEFRVAAHLGGDRVAVADIEGGEDIHQYTADTITAAGQPTTRQEAKAHTFKPLYGGMSGTDAEVAYYEAFKRKYDGISSAQNRWKNVVLEYGVLETEWGMRFYWPDTRMTRTGYITNSTSICNYPVQCFATAEIIPIAIVYFWHYIRAYGLSMFLVNTVHDSIIAELPEDERDAFHELSRKALIEDVYFYLRRVYDVGLCVPLGAGVMIGDRWSDAESKKSEVVYNAPRELYVQPEQQ